MPKPIDRPSSYLPALDGLRALAVIAVIGYHLRTPGLRGGFLGVAMFFTLSGYLITTLLRREWAISGRIDLRRFWSRRARRLIPGMAMLLLVVVASTAIADPGNLGKRSIEALGGVVYLSNWFTIVRGGSYFDHFAGAGPLDHLWSLAIEEQFYLVFPLLFIGLMKLCRSRRTDVAAITAAIALLSFVLLDQLASAGLDNTRAYEGTDTRVGGLLLGVSLALVWAPQRSRSAPERLTGRRLQLLAAAGAIALAIAIWFVITTNPLGRDVYSWKLFAFTAAVLVMLCAASHPESAFARVIGQPVLTWIGERSYGLYLWHLPLAVYISESAIPNRLVRSLVVVGLTTLIAEISWTLVENPIRAVGIKSAFGASWSSRPISGQQTVVTARAWLTIASVTLLCGTTLTAAAAYQRNTAFDPDKAALEAALGGPNGTAAVGTARGIEPGGGQSEGTDSITNPGDLRQSLRAPTANPQSAGPVLAPDSTTPPTDPALFARGRTSCGAVVHIGDSTSLGLVSPYFIADPVLRIGEQYKRVGSSKVELKISGARSIVERYKNKPNAQDEAKAVRASGFRGCWVFALGTNDSANLSVGGAHSPADRIKMMMGVAAGDPVMWATVKTLNSSGPYNDKYTRDFNAALRAACAIYPNMRVYDWRSEVDDTWFMKDKVHFTPVGSTRRAQGFASALASAFPAGANPSNRCFVSSSGVNVDSPPAATIAVQPTATNPMPS